jgi:hypothetical protein
MQTPHNPSSKILRELTAYSATVADDGGQEKGHIERDILPTMERPHQGHTLIQGRTSHATAPVKVTSVVERGVGHTLMERVRLVRTRTSAEFGPFGGTPERSRCAVMTTWGVLRSFTAPRRPTTVSTYSMSAADGGGSWGDAAVAGNESLVKDDGNRAPFTSSMPSDCERADVACEPTPRRIASSSASAQNKMRKARTIKWPDVSTSNQTLKQCDTTAVARRRLHGVCVLT